MSIDEIKEAYQTFAKEVFSGSKSGASARLEASVKNIVKQYTGNAEARLVSGPRAKSGVQCNTYAFIISNPSLLFTFFLGSSVQSLPYTPPDSLQYSARTRIQRSAVKILQFGKSLAPPVLLPLSSIRPRWTAYVMWTVVWDITTPQRLC